MARPTAPVVQATLLTAVGAGAITVDMPVWLACLERAPTFVFGGPAGPA